MQVHRFLAAGPTEGQLICHIVHSAPKMKTVKCLKGHTVIPDPKTGKKCLPQTTVSCDGQHPPHGRLTRGLSCCRPWHCATAVLQAPGQHSPVNGQQCRLSCFPFCHEVQNQIILVPEFTYGFLLISYFHVYFSTSGPFILSHFRVPL